MASINILSMGVHFTCTLHVQGVHFTFYWCLLCSSLIGKLPIGSATLKFWALYSKTYWNPQLLIIFPYKNKEIIKDWGALITQQFNYSNNEHYFISITRLPVPSPFFFEVLSVMASFIEATISLAVPPCDSAYTSIFLIQFSRKLSAISFTGFCLPKIRLNSAFIWMKKKCACNCQWS